MRRPDRRSFDSPRRGGRDDPFQSSRGQSDPYTPRVDWDAPVAFPSRDAAPAGAETGAVVKWYNDEKGFGFVELEGGRGDAFLHASVLTRAGHSSVAPGALLRIRVGQGQKGPQVSEVLHLDASAAAPAGGPASPRRPSYAQPGYAQHGQGQSGAGSGATVEMRGTVKWYNAEKGFGFIMPEGGGKDIFVHATALTRGGVSGLEPNQAVRLQVGEGRRGPEAVSIELT